MKSLILSTIFMVFSKFLNALSESFVGKAFTKIYNGISKSFSNSFIVNLFLKEGKDENLVSKVLRFPFYILELIGNKAGDRIKGFYEKSIILHLFDSFYNGYAALNTRFLGIMFVGISIGIIPFITKAVWVTVLSLILMLSDINLTDLFEGSFFVNLAKKVTGFDDLKFNIYDKGYNKKASLVMGFFVGLLTEFLFIKSSILLFFPVLIVGLIAVFKYPIVGIFGALFLAPLVPTMMLAGICMLSLASLVLNKLSDKSFRYKTGEVGIALILLLVLLFLTSLFSFNPAKSLMVWAMYLVFFSFYFVIVNTVSTKEQLFGLLRIFVLSGFIVALYGVIQYVFKLDTTNLWIDEEMFEDAKLRAYSTLENPNVLGEYLLLMLPLSAVFMLCDKKNMFSKYSYSVIFAVLALCLVFTQSRGCWLGFILSALIFICLYEGRLFALAPAIILLLPFVLPETIINRLMSIGNMEDTSTSYRVYIWFGTIALLKDYWLGGIGMGEGAFSKVYPFYSYNGITAPHSHNLFLQLTVEGGVMTLVVFIAVILIFISAMAKIYRKTRKHSLENTLSLALGAGVLGFMLQSMFDYTFYNYRVMAIFIMYLAIGAVLKFLLKESAYEKNN